MKKLTKVLGILIYISPIFIAGVSVSCLDNESEEVLEEVLFEEEEVELFLKRVTKDGVLLSEYDYNEDSLIASIKNYDVTGSLSEEFLFSYQDDTVIRSYSDVGTTIINKYYRLDEQVLRQDVYSNDILSSVRLFKFNEDEFGCGHNRIEYYNESEELIQYDEISYTDENCSYQQEFFDIDDISNGLYEITKSDKKSAYRSTRLLIFGLENTNTDVEVSFTNSSGILVENSSYTSQYVYNSDDYPTKETRTYSAGIIINVFEFEYY